MSGGGYVLEPFYSDIGQTSPTIEVAFTDLEPSRY